MAKLFALQPDRQAGGRRQLAAARMAIAGVAAGVTAPLEYYAGPGSASLARPFIRASTLDLPCVGLVGGPVLLSVS